MALEDDLRIDVARFFSEQWTTRKGQKVPDSSDLQLANDAVTLNATVLYADMTDSTHLV